MIICDFKYYIYNKKSECILNTVSISPIGTCNDCITPDIGDKTLDKYKKEMLQRLEQKPIKKKEQKKTQKIST